MDEKIIDRLRQWQKSSGTNDNQVTVKAGLSQGLLFNARIKGGDLSGKTVKKILAAFPDIDSEWLKTGHTRLESNKEISVNGVDMVLVPKSEYERLRKLEEHVNGIVMLMQASGSSNKNKINP